jgi:hypothetical protein
MSRTRRIRRHIAKARAATQLAETMSKAVRFHWDLIGKKYEDLSGPLKGAGGLESLMDVWDRVDGYLPLWGGQWKVCHHGRDMATGKHAPVTLTAMGTPDLACPSCLKDGAGELAAFLESDEYMNGGCDHCRSVPADDAYSHSVLQTGLFVIMVNLCTDCYERSKAVAASYLEAGTK